MFGSDIASDELPPAARSRLDRLLASDRPFFTSDLTVNEFRAVADAGFQPISQVMGGSVFHIGRQKYYEWMSNCELEKPTGALNDVRKHALRRLSREAKHIHADAVVGVHMSTRSVGWTSHTVECSVVGTAVRLQDTGHNPAEPILTNLSGQDFWTLLKSGYHPMGICAGSSVFTALSPWKLAPMGKRGIWTTNQELDLFTQAQQDARRLASGRAYSQAQRLGAEGIVGVEIERDAESEGHGPGRIPERLIFRFTVVGTAVTRIADAGSMPTVKPTMNLNCLQRSDNVS